MSEIEIHKNYIESLLIQFRNIQSSAQSLTFTSEQEQKDMQE